MLRVILNLVVSAVALGLIVFFLRMMIGTDPKALPRMIDRADKLIVFNVWGDPPTAIFESTDRKDFDALKMAIDVRIPRETIHCACMGTERIVLYRNGETLGWVSNQHCKNVRFSGWHTDAELVDAEAFVTWFDQRKIPGPREQVEKAKAQDKEREESERKWLAAMPSSLRARWPEMRNSFDTDTKPLLEALAKEIVEPKARILALFSWYGSGAGPWSGYSIHEDVPQRMLLESSTTELLAAVNRDNLTEHQLEGAARFFGGWDFSQKRPNDLTLLPADFKKKLLDHSLKSKDDDIRQRATKAFAEK